GAWSGIQTCAEGQRGSRWLNGLQVRRLQQLHSCNVTRVTRLQELQGYKSYKVTTLRNLQKRDNSERANASELRHEKGKVRVSLRRLLQYVDCRSAIC